MTRRKAALLAAAATLCLAAEAHGGPEDGFLHLVGPSTITTQGGATLHVPPGYYMDEPTFDKLDDEVRALQERTLRLETENRVLREHAKRWTPGWKTIGLALGVGLATGGWLVYRYGP